MTSGVLDVDLVRGRDGRTRVAQLIHQFPQRVTVPMYLDENEPGRAHLCVQNPSAGVFPGDRLQTRIHARAGTALYLTAQSATQVFASHSGSETDHATAAVDITVSAGATVEYFPKTVIPHSGSDYRQTTTLTVELGGVYVGWESLAAGRIGHGERNRYRRCDLRTSVLTDGRVRARDRLLLQPVAGGVSGPGVLHGQDYLATLIVVAPGQDMDAMLSSLRAEAARHEPLRCGVSALPGGVGVMARVVVDRAPTLTRIERAMRSVATHQLSGRAASSAAVRM
ncbi:urease accessory protein UreD [Mycolicibacterium sp. S2-37]|uniref:urease accessory protein UreD n=1 Tax=Mycolicibacterium sp. S2-37 TaxID=2810297 RepID=UPI001A953633|nr:urease accessory protein UreD [Mycolicibacterium sp. S2-37]MBO0681013.1 urease accessory protein UreD [Mycolicibacterium sp. S2-37]